MIRALQPYNDMAAQNMIIHFQKHFFSLDAVRPWKWGNGLWPSIYPYLHTTPGANWYLGKRHWGWVKIISLYISTSPGFYRNIRDLKRMYLKLQSCHLTLMAHDETAGNELLASVLMWINLFHNFLGSGLQKVKCKASVNKSKSFPTLMTHIKVLLKRPWIPNCITNKGKYL